MPGPIYFTLLLIYIWSISCQTVQLQNDHITSASFTSDLNYHYYYFSIPTQIQLLPSIPNIYLTIASCNIIDLDAYLSTSSNITNVKDGIPLNNTNGLMTWSSNHSVSKIWLAVGKNQTKDVGDYEIGISTSQNMHLVHDSTDSIESIITLDDTDTGNALFLTGLLSGTLPNNTLIITSDQPDKLSQSSCAAKFYAISDISVNQTMTTRGPTNSTRYQLFASGLTESSSYRAYLLQISNNIVGMSSSIAFQTKKNSVCQLIHDLPFCDQVAYSVATNPTTDRWSLANLYDDQARIKFEPFALSLSQFNCESTQYSLVRNCTDCYRDYKAWLCSVTIPRCTDSSGFNQTNSELTAPAIREVPANKSRNSWIDSTLGPSDSTELLPCIDLCYHVVQSCPPYMQFYCPVGDMAISQYGYWNIGNTVVNDIIYKFDANRPTCNRMGLDSNQLTITSDGFKLEKLSYFLCIGLIALILL